MPRKKLTKNNLLELILKNPQPELYAHILEAQEIQSMMLHQWENPKKEESIEQPDFNLLFDKIKETIVAKEARIQSPQHILETEINNLKIKNSRLNKRFVWTMSVAASLFLLISVSAFLFISKTQPFKTTYTENIAPKGQKSQVVLPDGSTVFLNSGSIIRYDNYFGKTSRNITLTGEAYFEVERNEKIPFIISTEKISIQVLGTKFNVAAYHDDNIVETTVTEGKVSVSEINGSGHVYIVANQKATFHKTTGLLLVNDVNSSTYSGWKDNQLSFDNENFASVIKKLERWYDVSISVSGKDSLDDRFTMTISNESLKDVLELISLTTPIDFTIKENKVTIKYN